MDEATRSAASTRNPTLRAQHLSMLGYCMLGYDAEARLTQHTNATLEPCHAFRDERHKAMRELSRGGEAAVDDLKSKRQQISPRLLRFGLHSRTNQISPAVRRRRTARTICDQSAGLGTSYRRSKILTVGIVFDCACRHRCAEPAATRGQWRHQSEILAAGIRPYG
jgi:hypothetical protein